MLRREVILGGALTLVFGSPCPCGCAAREGDPRGSGCYVGPEEAETIFRRADPGEIARPALDKVEYRSGSAMFDYAMARTLAHISSLSTVRPAFAFFTEEGSKNAFATDVGMLDEAQGTVLFGKKMIAYALQTFEADCGPAIAAICAHEFGHVIAYRRGLASKLMPDRSRPFRSEQFADFFAGWYSGRRKRDDIEFPALVFARCLSSLTLPERGTHGTSIDRTLAVVEGFKTAFERKMSLDDAVEEGVRYALSQPEI